MLPSTNLRTRSARNRGRSSPTSTSGSNARVSATPSFWEDMASRRPLRVPIRVLSDNASSDDHWNEGDEDEIRSESELSEPESDTPVEKALYFHPQHGWCLKIVYCAAFFGLLLLVLSIFRNKEDKDIAPPCHVQSNPNHLIPCAIAVDLNRALSVDPNSIEPYNLNDLFRHEYKLNDGALRLRLWSSRFGRRETTELVDLHVEILDFFEKTFREIPEPLYGLTYALFKIVGLDFKNIVILNNITEVTDFIDSLYDFASTIPLDAQEAADLVRTNLDEAIRRQYRIALKVHNETELFRRAGPKSTESGLESLSDSLQSSRRALIVYSFAEAKWTCWLQVRSHFEAQRAEWAQEIAEYRSKLLDEVKMIQDPRLLRIHLEEYVSLWQANASRIMGNEQDFARLDKACIKEWVTDRIRHCVAESEDVLDPTGSGCISHPNPMLWEWHNAIPMDVSEAAMKAPETAKTLSSRFWMRSVFTAADLAKYTKVQHGGKGVLIKFNESFSLGIGPLRFMKMKGKIPEK